jgi:CelD/BcsL family acetyltransferase involved in cellulose biosynthesis
MRVELLTDWTAFETLAEEWNALLAASAADTIFLTWEWIQAWRRAVDEGVEPFVVTVRDSHSRRLLGIGPFYRCRLRVRGGSLAYRCLRTLGDYPTGAEYPDWILHREHEEAAASAIATALAHGEWRREWDLLWMPHLSGWSGAYERLTRACREAGLLWRARPTDFAALRLPASYEAYERSLSHNARSVMRRSLRRVFEQARGRFERCRSAEALPDFLQALFELNTRRWQAAGQRGTFERKPREARFYREFAPVALARGWLELAAIRIGEGLKAVDIGYRYDGRFFYLQGGFDPEGPRGLGHALRTRLIAELIAEGVREFDFLGTVTDYKTQFGGEVRYGYQLFIARPGLKTWPVYAAGLWPTGRYMAFEGLPA